VAFKVEAAAVEAEAAAVAQPVVQLWMRRPACLPSSNK